MQLKASLELTFILEWDPHELVLHPHLQLICLAIIAELLIFRNLSESLNWGHPCARYQLSTTQIIHVIFSTALVAYNPTTIDVLT